MESLVNYSSEDEHDDYPYAKVAVRGSGVSAGSGRTGVSGPLKRSYEHSKSVSSESETFHRKAHDAGNDRFNKSGTVNYNEDKYKIDRRADKSRDHREKRGSGESSNKRDGRDDDRDCDHNKKYDHKKLDDHKRYKEHKRDYKHEGNDFYRDDKRYNRYDERKPTYAANKDRFNSSKPRFDDRFNNERRSSHEDRRGGSYIDDRRREFNDRRSYNNDDDRKTDRRNEDRRTQRSYNEDRSNAYRPRRSNSPPPSTHNRKSINKYSERKEDNSARRERKRYSRSRTRSRSRSRSHSPDNTTESSSASLNSSRPRVHPTEHTSEIKRPESETQISEKKILPTARNFEALLTLPLSENAPKNNVTVPVTTPAAGSNTTVAAVQLPSYYNPNVINPNKYVEQMQKRKLIWGAKKTEDSASKWGHAQFSQDQDGKVASKFMRLMGIKNASVGGESSNLPNESDKKSPTSTSPSNNTDVKSREAMFSTMEQQYEVARQVTHTMRGVGLGFGSQSRPY